MRLVIDGQRLTAERTGVGRCLESLLADWAETGLPLAETLVVLRDRGGLSRVPRPTGWRSASSARAGRAWSGNASGWAASSGPATCCLPREPRPAVLAGPDRAGDLRHPPLGRSRELPASRPLAVRLALSPGGVAGRPGARPLAGDGARRVAGPRRPEDRLRWSSPAPSRRSAPCPATPRRGRAARRSVGPGRRPSSCSSANVRPA